MPIPEFVLEIRKHIGHELLPLVGAVGVVVDRDRVLLHRRSESVSGGYQAESSSQESSQRVPSSVKCSRRPGYMSNPGA